MDEDDEDDDVDTTPETQKRRPLTNDIIRKWQKALLEV